MDIENTDLSISDAVDSLAVDLNSSEKQPDGSEVKKVIPVEGYKEVKPEAKVENKEEQDKSKQPVIDPEKGAYNGEYTKDRFDGLMSAWQKDRQLASKIPELESKVKELEMSVKAKPNDSTIENQQEELPPELQSADPETQAGFRLLMKANEGKMSKLEEKIVGKIMESLNRPIKEENEIATKVAKEKEGLSVEFGKDFSDNIKEITKFAIDNDYPLGTLKHAFKAWKAHKEIETLKGKKSEGQKTLAEIEAEKARKGSIPTGGVNRTGEIPKWDEKRDGNKSLSEILDDVKEYL